MRKILKPISAFIFIIILSINVLACSGSPGKAYLNIFNGSAFPYDDDGCKASTAFTGCFSGPSEDPRVDNIYSVDASFTYLNLSGVETTKTGSKEKEDDVWDAVVRLEGTSDDGIKASSEHQAMCRICEDHFYESLSEKF